MWVTNLAKNLKLKKYQPKEKSFEKIAIFQKNNNFLKSMQIGLNLLNKFKSFYMV